MAFIVACVMAMLSIASELRAEFWTEFTPSSDTRIIYVSASDGVDTSLYHYHTVGDEEVGGDPFNPVGEVYAYRSLSVAISKLRDGYPDWLLLKRGDTWVNESLGLWTKSGRGANEPVLVASYGPSMQRPRIHTGDSSGIVCWGDPLLNYAAFAGLEFNPHTRTGASDVSGVLWFGNSQHILFEDCKIHRFYNNVTMQSPSSQINHVAFRRCVIVDAFTIGAGHTQGMYFSGVHNLFIEECVIDHNGWSESIPGAGPTIFRHNTYVHHNCGPAIFRGNIVARASSTGIGARSGGLVEENLILRNPVNLGIGHGGINWPSEAVSGTARNNVILDSADINDHNVGWGINLAKVSSAEVYGNIVAHQTTAYGGRAISAEMDYQDITIRDNVVHNWRGTQSNEMYIPALALYGSPGGTNLIRNNQLQQMQSGRLVQHSVGFDSFLYENNTYYSASDSSVWFSHGNNGLPDWIAASGETGAVASELPYPDPDRTIATYMQSLGQMPTLGAFLDEARQQSRHNWRPQYTAEAVNTYIRAGFGIDIPDDPCIGDIMPAGGNQLVNVDDLFALFMAWGPCQNCESDLNGDGVVDLQDMLTVMSAWGYCSADDKQDNVSEEKKD